MIIVDHIAALLWHVLAVYEKEVLGYDNTWLHVNGYIDYPWLNKYIVSFYWAVSTMVTILLYIPETMEETVFSVVTIWMTTGVFGYSLSLIG